MKQQWKILVPLMLSGGLMACTTTATQSPDTDAPTKKESSVEKDKATTPSAKKDVVERKKEKDSVVKYEQPKQKVVSKPKIVRPKVEGKKLSDGKLILGSKEWIHLPGLKENLDSRVDTGATTSSLSAVDVTPFERDGKDWVKFKIEHDGIKSEEVSLPVARWVRIKQANTEKGERRAVVNMWVEIGDLKEKTDFTLADRTHLAYPLLLGRSFFKDVAVVDVGRTYVQGKNLEHDGKKDDDKKMKTE